MRRSEDMNPLVLSDDEYRAVFERITQLALEYLATLEPAPQFSRHNRRRVASFVLRAIT